MLYLASTSDIIRVVTSSGANVDVHASYSDLVAAATLPTFGRLNTAIASAATTTIVASPAASTVRTVKTLTIRNRHASTASTVTIQHFDGTTSSDLIQFILAAGESAHYDENRGWTYRDARGREVARTDGLVSAAVSTLNTVVLASDVTNNNGTANTIADVTGLSFAVTAGETYWFEFVIPYTAAAATTGSRWCINGPSSPTAVYVRSEYPLTATTTTVNAVGGYDLPAASNASSLTTGNVATIWGTITPSANGTVIARFASEILSSAIVAKAGAICRWMRVL
jgi:hypothetical protein